VVAETVWDSPERQKYLSETIVEHLYRQGMLNVAEDLCQVRQIIFFIYSPFCHKDLFGSCELFNTVFVVVCVCVSCAVGVWSCHRYEYETTLLGAEPHSGGSENAGPQTSTGVCYFFLSV